MPVRRIPTSYFAITGRYPLKRSGELIAFESLLERDFLILADFDRDVASIEGQPVRFDWTDEKGRLRPYTLDFLIKFHPPGELIPKHQPGKLRPWLVEVKDRETLKKEWNEFHPKFRAATAYARERGWTFHLMTENRIRKPLLANARLLLEALDFPRDTARCKTLLQGLRNRNRLTVRELISVVDPESQSQAPFFQMIWWMVLQKEIGADLNAPLGLDTVLYSVEATPRILLTNLYR